MNSGILPLLARPTFKRHDRIKRQADFELLTRRGGRIARGPLVGFVMNVTDATASPANQSGDPSVMPIHAAAHGSPRRPIPSPSHAQHASRLGIRIGRRVGSAVVRNRIKRLLREAFRLARHDWPIVMDLVVSVQPHAVLSLSDYRSLLSEIARQAHKHRRNHSKTD